MPPVEGLRWDQESLSVKVVLDRWGGGGVLYPHLLRMIVDLLIFDARILS